MLKGEKCIVKGKHVVYQGEWDKSCNKSGLYKYNDKYFYWNKTKNKKISINKKDIIFDKTEIMIRDILNNKDKLESSHLKIGLTEKDKENILLPVIDDNDDILVKIIKNILIEERIPVKELKSRFSSPMEFNNFKRSLFIRNSISISGFQKWMEILKKQWEIKIEDK